MNLLLLIVLLFYPNPFNESLESINLYFNYSMLECDSDFNKVLLNLNFSTFLLVEDELLFEGFISFNTSHHFRSFIFLPKTRLRNTDGNYTLSLYLRNFTTYLMDQNQNFKFSIPNISFDLPINYSETSNGKLFYQSFALLFNISDKLIENFSNNFTNFSSLLNNSNKMVNNNVNYSLFYNIPSDNWKTLFIESDDLVNDELWVDLISIPDFRDNHFPSFQLFNFSFYSISLIVESIMTKLLKENQMSNEKHNKEDTLNLSYNSSYDLNSNDFNNSISLISEKGNNTFMIDNSENEISQNLSESYVNTNSYDFNVEIDSFYYDSDYVSYTIYNDNCTLFEKSISGIKCNGEVFNRTYANSTIKNYRSFRVKIPCGDYILNVKCGNVIKHFAFRVLATKCTSGNLRITEKYIYVYKGCKFNLTCIYPKKFNFTIEYGYNYFSKLNCDLMLLDNFFIASSDFINSFYDYEFLKSGNVVGFKGIRDSQFIVAIYFNKTFYEILSFESGLNFHLASLLNKSSFNLSDAKLVVLANIDNKKEVFFSTPIFCNQECYEKQQLHDLKNYTNKILNKSSSFNYLSMSDISNNSITNNTSFKLSRNREYLNKESLITNYKTRNLEQNVSSFNNYSNFIESNLAMFHIQNINSSNKENAVLNYLFNLFINIKTDFITGLFFKVHYKKKN